MKTKRTGKQKIFAVLAALFTKLSKWDMNVFSSVVRHAYQHIIQREFVLTHKIIHVKKGKIKYDLLVLETSAGKVKFNLGRHHDGDQVLHDQTVIN